MTTRKLSAVSGQWSVRLGFWLLSAVFCLLTLRPVLAIAPPAITGIENWNPGIVNVTVTNPVEAASWNLYVNDALYFNRPARIKTSSVMDCMWPGAINKFTATSVDATGIESVQSAPVYFTNRWPHAVTGSPLWGAILLSAADDTQYYNSVNAAAQLRVVCDWYARESGGRFTPIPSRVWGPYRLPRATADYWPGMRGSLDGLKITQDFSGLVSNQPFPMAFGIIAFNAGGLGPAGYSGLFRGSATWPLPANLNFDTLQARGNATTGYGFDVVFHEQGHRVNNHCGQVVGSNPVVRDWGTLPSPFGPFPTGITSCNDPSVGDALGMLQNTNQHLSPQDLENYGWTTNRVVTASGDYTVTGLPSLRVNIDTNAAYLVRPEGTGLAVYVRLPRPTGFMVQMRLKQSLTAPTWIKFTDADRGITFEARSNNVVRVTFGVPPAPVTTNTTTTIRHGRKRR